MAYQDIEKQLRECKKCGEIKNFEDFTRNKSCTFGLEWTCLSCTSLLNKERRSHQKKEIAEKNKIYREENKDKLKENRKIFREKNKEKLKEQKREHYLRHKEKIRANHKKYYYENRDKLKKSSHVYRKNNKEYLREWYRNHSKFKRETDLDYKLRGVLRARVKAALKWAGAEKAQKTSDLVGCSLDKLKKHIESTFQEGMTWDNHGVNGWHIDHVKACANFDLTDPEQQKECFHYTNMQALWAEDNIRKSNKLDWSPNE